jgi:hypothetical protein
MRKVISRKFSTTQKGWLHNVLIVSAFLIITFFLLYPRSIKLHNHIHSSPDGILDTWILAWGAHQVIADPLNFFNANIFYPHKRSLAYSDHMVGIGIFIWPVIWATDNPILGYNVAQIAVFFFSALGMYLLMIHITNNKLASFISAVIFAYCPYRFDTTTYLNICSIQWLPFILLFFFRLLKKDSFKDLAAFSFFFLVQFLTSMYVALILSIAICVTIIYQLINQKEQISISLIKKLIIFVVISTIVIFPFAYPYIQLNKEIPLRRDIQQLSSWPGSADGMDYFSTPRLNKVFYTKYLAPHRGLAWISLFPGFTPVLLCITALSIYRKEFLISPSSNYSGRKKVLLKFANYSFLINFAAVIVFFIFIIFFKPYTTPKYGITPLSILIYTLIALWFTKLIIKKFVLRSFNQESAGSYIDFFSFLLFIFFILSLGPNIRVNGIQMGRGLYYLLIKISSVFTGIRQIGHFGLIVIMSISIIAGIGAAYLLRRINSNWKRWFLFALIVCLLLFEYQVDANKHFRSIPRKPPEIHRWLARQPGEFAILELPIWDPGDDLDRMYWSTFHWKKIVNGTSTYFPREYWLLKYQLKGFPSEQTLKFLIKNYPVKYIIIDIRNYNKKQLRRLVHSAANFPEYLISRNKTKTHYAYELIIRK